MLSTLHHQTRRKFVKKLGIGTIALSLPQWAISQNWWLGQDKPKIGLQLWTVRELMKQDMPGTLEKVAEIGYMGVESAFLPEGVTHKQLGKLLKKLDLPVFSMHAELPIGDQREVLLDMAEAYDCNRMIWHGWPEDIRYKTEEGTKQLAEIYNQSNAFAKNNGLVFGIHNHWWEFERQEGGKYPYEILLNYLDTDIFFEIDTYWVKVAGLDPAHMVKLFGKRAPLLHIKDGPGTWTKSLDEDEPEPMVAVGKGVQDFPKISQAAQGATEWMIVELDRCATDMMEAVQDSYQYLTQEGLAVGKA